MDPALERAITAELRNIYMQMEEQDKQRKREYQDIMTRLDAIQREMREMWEEGQFTIQWMPGGNMMAHSHQGASTSGGKASPRPREQEREQEQETTPISATYNFPATPPENSPTSDTADNPRLHRQQESATDPSIPSYRLPRDIKTVKDLLRLWRHGVSGMPSIDSLEERWGSRWRPRQEKQFFSTRKIIIDEVVRNAKAQGLTEEAAAEQMDRKRANNSLDKVFRAIRSRNL